MFSCCNTETKIDDTFSLIQNKNSFISTQSFIITSSSKKKKKLRPQDRCSFYNKKCRPSEQLTICLHLK